MESVQFKGHSSEGISSACKAKRLSKLYTGIKQKWPLMVLICLIAIAPGLIECALATVSSCRDVFLETSSPNLVAANPAFVEEGDVDRYLFRVVYGQEPAFDQRGYLLPVEIDGEGSHVNRPILLPLVHPEEWVTIAQIFALPKFKKRGRAAWLLKIRKDKIKSLMNKEHTALPKHGEFFGVVPKEAIEQQIQFIWRQTPQHDQNGRGANLDWTPVLAE